MGKTFTSTLVNKAHISKQENLLMWSEVLLVSLVLLTMIALAIVIFKDKPIQELEVPTHEKRPSSTQPYNLSQAEAESIHFYQTNQITK